MKKLFVSILLFFYLENTLAVCSINVGNLNFGVYNPVTSGDNISSTTVNVTCLPNILYSVYLTTGNSNNFTDRQMLGGYKGTDVLHYNLYTNTSRTTIWGDGTNGTSYLGGLIINISTIFGKVPQLQNVSAGSYIDNITVQINY